MSITRRRNLLRSICSIIIFLVIFLASERVFPVIPIQGSSLGGNSPTQARIKLLAAAETYLGTPYVYGGIDSRGLDCSGFVYVSFRDTFGIQIPRSSGAQYSWTERISPGDMRPGDLVFFAANGRDISHVGIYTGNREFIHAPSEEITDGVMYSSLDQSWYQRTFVGAGRALPWDSDAEKALANGSFSNYARNRPVATASSQASVRLPGQTTPVVRPAPKPWAQSTGYFYGFGLNTFLGGFVDGSVFRGVSVQAKIGYKGLFRPDFQVALELRPSWDSFLGIGRIPLTLAVGNDSFQVFAGPAFVIGQPSISSRNRDYTSDLSLLGEIGVSLSLPPITMFQGNVSFYSELAWQSYFSSTGQGTDLGADLAANLRFSLGLRYQNLLNL